MQIPKYFYFRVKPGKFDFIFEDASDVDVAEVVRCKDCGYSYDDTGGLRCSYGVCVDCIVPEDFFCRYGERKGEGE